VRFLRELPSAFRVLPVHPNFNAQLPTDVERSHNVHLSNDVVIEAYILQLIERGSFPGCELPFTSSFDRKEYYLTVMFEACRGSYNE
jgi:hypothetical protein